MVSEHDDDLTAEEVANMFGAVNNEVAAPSRGVHVPLVAVLAHLMRRYNNQFTCRERAFSFICIANLLLSGKNSKVSFSIPHNNFTVYGIWNKTTVYTNEYSVHVTVII